MPPRGRSPSNKPRSRMDSTRPVRHAGRVAVRDLKRLASSVKAARNDLGMSQEDFARRAELGLKTLQRIELEKVTPRGKTLTSLDRAAGWPSGTARSILDEGAERPATAELPTQEGTPVRYYDPVTDTVDDRAVIERMIALLPSVRARHGATEAERVRRTIITLAEDAGLIDFASSELDSLDSRRHQIG